VEAFFCLVPLCGIASFSSKEKEEEKSLIKKAALVKAAFLISL
jgi:hypothetical protein